MKDFRRPRKIGGGENLRRRLQPFAQNPRLFSGSVVNKARFKIKKKKQRLYVFVRKWKMMTGFI